MRKLKTYRIILRKEPEGVYTAFVPSLPGCITWGNTIDEAIAMAKEAVEGYIAVLEEEKELIPDDNETFEYSFQIA